VSAASAASATRRALVVGASSGIGAALARRLAREGWRVATVARREPELRALQAELDGAVLPYPHDVRQVEKTRPLFDRIVAELGGLDLVIYSSGVMPAVREDEYSIEKDREMIEVNVLGAAAWLDCAADHFERRRSGQIVGISSIAGDRGRRGRPGYCASKAWLDAFLESLRNRLTRHGVSVVTVKPGFIDTPMSKGVAGMFWLISADEAADLILRAARARAQVRYIPARWALIAFIIKRIPSVLFRRMKI
jgi:NAD(P)-dependent dehydrogenase (short-subunit alcohol dehydrogenase family)